MAVENLSLLFEARRALSLTQRGLASLLGMSLRTVQRVHSGGSGIGRDRWAVLARAIHPRNPDLAARIAASQHTTLEAFGIAPPPAARAAASSAEASSPAPVKTRPPSPRDADGVLCAAANVMNVPPRAVRPVLAAAFGRAKELGLSVETLAEALVMAEADEEKAGVGA